MTRFQVEAKQAMFKDYWLPVGKPYTRERDARARITRKCADRKIQMPADWYRIVTVELETVMNTFDIEVTDTFGGDANYCWVNRYTLEVPQGITDLAFMRRVKALIGWTGYRCEVAKYNGDMIDIRPSGMAQVCFVTHRDA